MVEPSQTDVTVTVTVPGELITRVEAADKATEAAADAVIADWTAGNLRALAAARRELADAYDELASLFVDFFPASYAMRLFADHRRDFANGNDRNADWLTVRAAGGDG